MNKLTKYLFVAFLMGMTTLATVLNAGTYTSMTNGWAISTTSIWVDHDLSGYGVPGNAICEVAIVNYNDGAEREGGVRSTTSSLGRKFDIAEGHDGGDVFTVMHVKADASSKISCYAENTSDVKFILLGYWENCDYVERYDYISVGSSDKWLTWGLSGYGVEANQVVEMMVYNIDKDNARSGGTRSVGSSLERRFTFGRPRDGGWMGTPFMVKVNSSSQVQVYSDDKSDIKFRLLGYWSEPPADYVEAWTGAGAPAADATWDTLTLSNVDNNDIVQLLARNNNNTVQRQVGFRPTGSGFTRTFNLKEAGDKGGQVPLSMHMTPNSAHEIDAYAQVVADTYRTVIGYWDVPHVETLAATNVTATSAYINGRINNSTGTVAYASVYYGDDDGETSTWDDSSSWLTPAWGDFSFEMTDVDGTPLSTNTTYFYRYMYNDGTNIWSDSSESFFTGEIWVEHVSDADEDGLIPGTVTVHRAASALSGDFDVSMAYSGSAQNGYNVEPLQQTVTIPDGQSSAVLEIIPRHAWFTDETTVTVSVATGAYLASATSVDVRVKNLEAPNTGGTNTWISIGTLSDNNPTNWSKRTLPVETDHILIGEYSSESLTWDSSFPSNVASWTQTDGYSATVTIDTRYPGQGAATNLTVAGDIIINGGTINNSGPTFSDTPKYYLSMSTDGDFTLGSGGTINVEYKGFSGRNGPGDVYKDRGGASHGGASVIEAGIIRQSYGSILAPTTLGSGGYKDYKDGGGAVRVIVKGHATLDGRIDVDGEGTYNNNGAAAAGSIFIQCSTIEGTGTLTANGGSDDNHGSGAGGRISLIATNELATFDDFTPATLTAYGAKKPNDGQGSQGAGAGTIYRQAGFVANGSVKVDNADRTATVNTLAACTVPSQMQNNDEDVSMTRWNLYNRGHLYIAEDRVDIVSLTADNNSTIKLDDHILVLSETNSLTINGVNFSNNFYTASDVNAIAGITAAYGYDTNYVSVGGVPIVEAYPGTVVGNDVTMMGGLVSTGTAQTAILVFYGDENGYSDVNAWDDSYEFSTDASEILYNHTITPSSSTVFYRFAASNENGLVWSAYTEQLSLAEINIGLVDVLAKHNPYQSGSVQFTRPEAATALPIYYSVTGTASNGVNFAMLDGSVDMLAGETSATIMIEPISNWTTEDSTVIISIAAGSYNIGASNVATVVIEGTPAPVGSDNAFLGGDSASSNSWSQGRLPIPTDDIVLGGWAMDSQLTWALPLTNVVASWTQTEEYSNTVIMATSYPVTGPTDFTNMTVTGDVTISGGAFEGKHNEGTDEDYRIFMTIGGNLTVDSGKSISVKSCGYKSGRGGLGPGGGGHSGSSWDHQGAGHGGLGGPGNSGAGYLTSKTYGSVLYPTSMGSGGYDLDNYSGGGAIHLTVGGTSTIDGSLDADGIQVGSNSGGGAGGSVCLNTASIAGSGLITAKGSSVVSGRGGGGGGRIAIIAGSGSLDDITLRATGGDSGTNPRDGAAGTIYTRVASAAKVLIENFSGASVYTVLTSYPSYVATDIKPTFTGTYSGTTFSFDDDLGSVPVELGTKGQLDLQDDQDFDSLNISASDAYLRLNNKTLVLGDLTILGVKYSAGTYTAADLPQVTDAYGAGTGEIIVRARGTLLIIQ